MNDKLQHHELAAEWIKDGQGRAIMLTQQDGSGCNEPSTILLNEWQLREVCERFDLIGSSDHESAKTIATLQRRLLILRDRIDELADYLCKHSDHKHADLSYEMTFANATADIAAEFVAELKGVQPCTVESDSTPAQSQIPEPMAQGTLL